jgi:hypothetical protein
MMEMLILLAMAVLMQLPQAGLVVRWRAESLKETSRQWDMLVERHILGLVVS